MWTPMHYNLFENVFCSTVIFQIQQNVSPLNQTYVSESCNSLGQSIWKHELFQYLFMHNYFS